MIERGETLTEAEYILKTGGRISVAPLRNDLFGRYCLFDRTQGSSVEAYIEFSSNLKGITHGGVVKRTNSPEEPISADRYRSFELPVFEWSF